MQVNFWVVAACSVVGIGILGLGLLSGCSFYNQQWRVDPQPADAPYDLEVVQVDDFGSFWDAGHAREVANRIDTWSKSENVFVVVFIHGWHNNAQPDNDNLRDFKKSLGDIADLMRDPHFAETREKLTGSRDFRLVGVYIGWRGKSLPMPLDYATMWWRKDAAERVGTGDAAEFLERLERTYLRANSTDTRRDQRIVKPFTGLVTIGHSFGGQVLLSAIARPIEEQLVERSIGDMADTANAPRAAGAGVCPERETIDSFGDVNILLNPALEAYQYARIDALYRDVGYDYRQTPQLLVFSADNDWARQSFFPIARVLTSPFRPAFRTTYQGQLWGKALGELENQQTHDLNLAAGTADSLTQADYQALNENLEATKAATGSNSSMTSQAGPNPSGGRIRNFDFTSKLVLGGVELKPRSGAIANSPVAVIYTHQDIIVQHTGIFTASLRNFLVPYIAFLEGKRMLLRAEKLQKAIDAPAYSPVVGTLDKSPQCHPAGGP